MTRILLTAFAVLLAGPAPAAFAAANTSPGKATVAAAAQSVTLSDQFYSPLLTVTIAKGKSKSLLTVEATMVLSGTQNTADIVPVVNGVSLEPGPAYADLKFSGAQVATAAGVWFLDLDAAEAANPGQFVNKPLVIQLMGENNSGNVNAPVADRVGIVARLVKK